MPQKIRPPRRLISLGETYGHIYVRSVAKTSTSQKKYHARCEVCGSEYIITGQQVLDWAKTDCSFCRSRKKAEDNLVKNRSYEGKIYGNFEILAVSTQKVAGKAQRVASCRCLACGSITDIPLSKILRGVVKECHYCARKNLEIGRTIAEEESKEGTRLSSLMRTSVNKNSRTGHSGVCFSGKRYRAYIVFKRKQFHLGTYDTLEEAVAAREAAEKSIYGDFLSWYQVAYPSEWGRFTARQAKRKDRN